jgi:hypothetical protein
VQSIAGFGVTSGGIQTAADRAELKAEVETSMELGEQAEAFRECPKCGSVNYSQHRARS